MPRVWFRTAVAAALLAAAAVRADPGDDLDPDLPPATDQPTDFDAAGGAVGSGFVVSQRVTPDSVTVGGTATLTLRIAAGKFKQPPRRPRLWELPSVKELEAKKLLKVERPDLRDKKSELPDRTPDAKTWEFDYKLRPLSPSLTRLPPLPFPYYTPSGTPGLPGRYQRTFSDEVPLKVSAPAEAAAAVPPIRAPEFMLQVEEGPAVRQRRDVLHLPSLPALVGLLLLPPLAGVGCYLAWRRLYPDAARRARVRQSRAAQHALKALQASGAATPDGVAAVAVGYLQQRLGMPGVAPTPVEVAAYLERTGAPPVLAGKAAEFFRACDAARFAPAPPTGPGELKAAASNLILTLENEPWSAPLS